MAFSFTVLDKGGSDTDGRDFTTGSCAFSAHPGKMFVAVLVTYDLNLQATGNGVCTGGGLTWTPRGAQGFTYMWLRYFTASGTGSDGTLAFTETGDPTVPPDGATWMVLAVDGVNISTNNGVVQSQAFTADNRTTADTLTLTALNTFASTDNACVAFFAARDTAAGGTINFTEGTGFTVVDEIDQTINNDTVTLFAEYKLNDTTADASVSAASDSLTGTALEIAAAGVASTVKQLATLGVG